VHIYIHAAAETRNNRIGAIQFAWVDILYDVEAQQHQDLQVVAWRDFVDEVVVLGNLGVDLCVGNAVAAWDVKIDAHPAHADIFQICAHRILE
jgi:hypothetical protein